MATASALTTMGKRMKASGTIGGRVYSSAAMIRSAREWGIFYFIEIRTNLYSSTINQALQHGRSAGTSEICGGKSICCRRSVGGFQYNSDGPGEVHSTVLWRSHEHVLR